MFYEHVDTRIFLLSYIKVKRFDNDIKTKTLQKLIQIMKLKKNENTPPPKKKQKQKQKTKQCHIVVSSPPSKNSKVRKSKDETTRPQSRRVL